MFKFSISKVTNIFFKNLKLYIVFQKYFTLTMIIGYNNKLAGTTFWPTAL